MKYMGSKNRIAKDILPIILHGRKPDQWYVEPFVGGANMIDKVTGLRIGADINEHLIELLKQMSLGWKPPYLSREEVTDIKEDKDLYSKHLVAWAGLGCSYCGTWFGGYAGKTVTKSGQIRDYIAEAINNFAVQALKLKGVVFIHSSYEVLEIPPNSIIYCDPPYKGTEGYRVKFYHEAFWQWCRDMTDAGHSVYISEYSAPEDFICIWQKELSSSLSANGKTGGSKKSIEKLYTYL